MLSVKFAYVTSHMDKIKISENLMSLLVIVLYIQCFVGSVNKIKITNCSLLVKENEHQHRC